MEFGSEKDNPLGKLWFYSKDGQPFEISQDESEQVIITTLLINIIILHCFDVTLCIQIPLGGLLLPRELQPKHEVRFYWRTGDYDIEKIRYGPECINIMS